jgi:hypothetical protein
MGNSIGCQCLSYNDNGELRTGVGIYKFKKIVYFFIY